MATGFTGRTRALGFGGSQPSYGLCLLPLLVCVTCLDSESSPNNMFSAAIQESSLEGQAALWHVSQAHFPFRLEGTTYRESLEDKPLDICTSTKQLPSSMSRHVPSSEPCQSLRWRRACVKTWTKPR